MNPFSKLWQAIFGPKEMPIVQLIEPCPHCGSTVFSNAVNVWCDQCSYGKASPVSAPNAKGSE